jgi:hypothetical protein
MARVAFTPFLGLCEVMPDFRSTKDPWCLEIVCIVLQIVSISLLFLRSLRYNTHNVASYVHWLPMLNCPQTHLSVERAYV